MLELWDRLPPKVRGTLRTLFTIALNGGVAALGSVVIDPEHFSLQHLKHLSIVFGAGAAAGVVNWLRQSPWKKSDENVIDRFAQSIPIVLLACVLGASSACSLSLKQKAVAGLQISETALEISHDAERRLCAPSADQTKGIGHCDGTQAAALGLTDAVHLKAAALYSRAFDLQGKAAAAAKKWRAGDPVPSDVVSYRLTLNDILDALASVVPKEQTVIAKLQEAINEAADLAKLAGVK